MRRSERSASWLALSVYVLITEFRFAKLCAILGNEYSDVCRIKRSRRSHFPHP